MSSRKNKYPMPKEDDFKEAIVEVLKNHGIKKNAISDMTDDVFEAILPLVSKAQLAQQRSALIAAGDSVWFADDRLESPWERRIKIRHLESQKPPLAIPQ